MTKHNRYYDKNLKKKTEKDLISSVEERYGDVRILLPLE